MITLTKQNQNTEKEKVGIYAFLALAIAASIILYSLSYFNFLVQENFFESLSLSTSFNKIIHQPYRLITSHFIIQDWPEALLCVITLQLIYRQKEEIMPSQFFGTILIFQLLQSLLVIFTLRALYIHDTPKTSVFPTLLTILLLANWYSFRENYLRIPFSSKYLPFSLLWLSIIFTTILFSYFTNSPAQSISIISAVISVYIVGVSYHYFNKKKPATELDKYTQQAFTLKKQSEHTTTTTYSATSKQEHLNIILDKINQLGINSLTSSEKSFLDSYAQEPNNNNR